MYTKDIVILAKSLKNNGVCIGGLDIENGKWVRPVKTIPSESFKQTEIDKLCINFKRKFKLLDIIKMTFNKRTPLNFQPENELLDLNTPWILKGTYIEKLDKLVDLDKNQLMDWSIQFYSRQHDKIPATAFVESPATNSLQFIKLTKEQNNPKIIYRKQNSWSGVVWNPRLEFTYKDKPHNLVITDLSYPKLSYEPNEIEKLINACFVSIGFGAAWKPPSESFGLQHYKLIAGIIIE